MKNIFLVLISLIMFVGCDVNGLALDILSSSGGSNSDNTDSTEYEQSPGSTVYCPDYISSIQCEEWQNMWDTYQPTSSCLNNDGGYYTQTTLDDSTYCIFE